MQTLASRGDLTLRINPFDGPPVTVKPSHSKEGLTQGTVTVTLFLSGDIYVGLAVTAHRNNGTAQAVFDDFSIGCQ